ncbi:NAD(P)/FAD-dependent oxidoreductase [Halorussus amylolyticus]|uniref:NAD(P)/FAD-dependent oxidoreductase n=1 Tax=Halorussus amylolyticus TaxID=1126242 RepID=UPI00104F1ACC|nr:FAD-dependent oxidoreductase [Halorussus amylolyticus]
MQVSVVGGGIIGLASAYYLAERGADVTLYERGSLGSGSTERSAGGIRAQFSTPVNVELSLASMEVWDTFEEDFDTDIAYRRAGYLFLARDHATAAQFEDNVAMQNDRGVPSRLLDPEEATEHCPELHAEKFVAATYSPTDGFADPHLALQGFATAAHEAGVEVRTKTPVTDIHREGDGEGRVTGLTADGEREETDYVVNAAGPWAGKVAEMAGVTLPVAPKRRQMLVVDPETPVPENVPLTIDLDTGTHFRPEREGAALVGGHFDGPDPDADPDAFSEKQDLDWAVEAIERAADCAGYFGPDSRIKRGWAGLYAVTPDHHPILEETVPGLVNNIGFSGHGFQHAPATGRIVTELIFDGEASLVDISSLGSDRFEDGDLLEERNVA